MSDQGFQREDYERMLMEVRIELQDSEGERRRLLRKSRLLEQELAGHRRDTPEMGLVEDLFDLWVKLRGKNKNTKLGPKRAKAGLAAAKRHEAAELRKAIEGICKFPFVVNGKRSESGRADQLYDEFELALRDEVNVEKFAALASEHVKVLEPRKGDPFWRPLERALYALTREFGRDVTEFFPAPAFSREQLAAWAKYEAPLPDLGQDEWWCICPVRPHGLERPLRIRERGGEPGARLELACVHEGCSEELLRAELRRLEWRRVYGAVDAPPGEVAA